jgi:hypothetical protein
MMRSADEGYRPPRAWHNLLKLVALFLFWVVWGWLVVGVAAMFLVNPRINGDAWLAGILILWLASYFAAAWVLIRKRD